MANQATCSVCGYRVRVGAESRRCPKCGAQMESTAQVDEQPAAPAPPNPPTGPPVRDVTTEPSTGDVSVRVLNAPSLLPSPALRQANPPLRTTRRPKSWGMTVAVVGVIAIGALVAWAMYGPPSGDSKYTASNRDKKSSRAKKSDSKRKTKDGTSKDATSKQPSRPEKLSFAQHLARLEPAMVKVEVPVGRQMGIGAGFVIDRRGWIATNDHVVAQGQLRSMRVRMVDGTVYRVQRVLARSPQRDMAILQIADPPSNLTVVDLSFRTEPHKGSRVYAYGHPHNNDFSVTEGIVSKVLTTGELPQGAKRFVVHGIQGDPDHVWIQTDAKISPGNSGGPLISEDGKVIGMNTWVNTQVDFGYASHIRYLRELKKTIASD